MKQPSMTQLWRDDPLFTACFALLLAGGAALFWVFDYLPLQDLPQHLALNSVLLNYSDSRLGFSEYYQFDWSAWSYLTFRAFNLVVGYFSSPMLALRLLLTLYAIALPVAFLFCLRRLQRTHWLSFLAFPLVFNTNLHWGFISFCLSLPLLVLALAALERRLSEASQGVSWSVSLLGLAIFATHAQSFLAWCCVAGAFFILDRRYKLRSLLTDLGPGVLLFGLWTALTFGRNSFGLGKSSWLSLEQNWVMLEHAIFLATNFAEGFFWERLWIVASLVLLIGLVIGNHNRWALSSETIWSGLRYELLTLWFLGLYFVLPYSIGGQFYVNPRMAVFAVLVAGLSLKNPLDGAIGRWLGRPLLVLLAAAYLLLNGQVFLEFQQKVGQFDRAVETIPRGKRVYPMAFRKSLQFVTRMDFSHFGGYYVARRGGLVPYGWHSNGVKIKPRWVFWPPDWIQYRFSYGRLGKYFHYYLFRDAGRFGRPHPMRGVAPGRVRRIFRSKHWEVWQNLKPVEPPHPR